MNGIEQAEITAAKKSFETIGLKSDSPLTVQIGEAVATAFAGLNKVVAQPGTDASRYIGLAKTNLEQALMWASRGFLSNGVSGHA